MEDEEKEHGLSPQEHAFYQENGYVLAKGVFTREEAAGFRDEAHDLARRLAESGVSDLRNQGWGAGAKVTDLPRE